MPQIQSKMSTVIRNNITDHPYALQTWDGPFPFLLPGPFQGEGFFFSLYDCGWFCGMAVWLWVLQPAPYCAQGPVAAWSGQERLNLTFFVQFLRQIERETEREREKKEKKTFIRALCQWQWPNKGQKLNKPVFSGLTISLTIFGSLMKFSQWNTFKYFRNGLHYLNRLNKCGTAGGGWVGG